MSEQVSRFDLTPQAMVPDLLARYPQTRRVLDRYGLRGCGGPNGPHESLQFFSRMHGIDVATLMDELRQVVVQSVDHQRVSRRAHGKNGAPTTRVVGIADAIYRPYFLGGIAVVLTLGAVWGAWLLWKIGFAGNFLGVSVHEVNAHGHAQIFGWVGLFIMGFALQALPRMWHVELPAPRLALGAFVAMVAGILLRTAAMTAAGTTWAVPGAMVGGTVELVAIVAFAGILLTAFLRRQVAMEPYIAFILAGLGWFVLQAAFSLWHTWMTMTAVGVDQLVWYVSTYQAPLRDVQIHGMALFMILGVSMRMFPALFGLPRIGDRRAWTGFTLLLAAVAGEVIIFIAYRWTGNHTLAAALMVPWIMLATGIALVALPWRLWQPLPTHDRSAKFVRAAYGWLAVALAMLLLLPVYQLVSGTPFSHAYYGAIRHAITVGFISLMIMGIAAKVVPTLTGRDPQNLSMLWWPFVLVNVGCLLRVSTQTLTDWHPAFFGVVGISGTLEVTGLAIWGVHLGRMMLARSSAPERRAAGPPPATVELDHVVADVLAWYPQTLPVLERFGFTLLRNPVVRRTMARQVTLRQAASMRSVATDKLLEDLNKVIHSASLKVDERTESNE